MILEVLVFLLLFNPQNSPEILFDLIIPGTVTFDQGLDICRPYGGCFAVKKVVGSRFIIVSGDLSFRTIQDFLAEFYHPNHNKGEVVFS